VKFKDLLLEYRHSVGSSTSISRKRAVLVKSTDDTHISGQGADVVDDGPSLVIQYL